MRKGNPMSCQKKNQTSVRHSISGVPVKPRRHKAYSAEFREKAVKMITELGYTAGEMAKQLDCSVSAIQRWKRERAVPPQLPSASMIRESLPRSFFITLWFTGKYQRTS